MAEDNGTVIQTLNVMLDSSVPPPAVPASGSRVNFMWTDFAMKLLINAAYKQEAYKKTAINMDKKWELVRAELTLHPTFRTWTDMSAKNLRQKFNRFKDDTSKKYALDQEGANLSGLDAEASDCDHLMIGILQELAEIKECKDEYREKESKQTGIRMPYKVILS